MVTCVDCFSQVSSDASAGDATFRHDSSLTRVVNPVGDQETNAGWIKQGRDTALEQRILGQLLARMGPTR